LDAHIESCLTAKGADLDARSFVAEVVYGLHRFRRFLSAFLEGFFHVNRFVLSLSLGSPPW